MRWFLMLGFALTAASAETWVIAAGVSQYDDPAIAPLRYATEDAVAVAGALGAGLPADRVTLLSSDATDRKKLPTKFNLLHALQAVREKAVGGDNVILFFAGHGVEQAGAAYLLTVDSVYEQLAATALPVAVINDTMRGFQGANLLLLVDACRNDPQAARSTGDAALGEEFARALRPRLNAPAARPAKVAALLSCDVGQRAWEIPDQKHGAFTTWLLKGLAGEAKGQDGQVWLSALAGYVMREVPAWAARAQKEQTPRFDNPEQLDFALCRPGSRPVSPPVAVTEAAPTDIDRPAPLALGGIAKGKVEAAGKHFYEISLERGTYQLLLDVRSPRNEPTNFYLSANAYAGDERRVARAYVIDTVNLERCSNGFSLAEPGKLRLEIDNSATTAADYCVAVAPDGGGFVPLYGTLTPTAAVLGEPVGGQLAQNELAFVMFDLPAGDYDASLTVKGPGGRDINVYANLHQLDATGVVTRRLTSLIDMGSALRGKGSFHLTDPARVVLRVQNANQQRFDYSLTVRPATP